MSIWKEQDAKARFRELLKASTKDGPQVITRHGAELAVLVSINEWKRLQKASRGSLKALLLAPKPRFPNIAVKRETKVNRRKETAFSKYRGIGNSEIGSGKKSIGRWVRNLRGR